MTRTHGRLSATFAADEDPFSDSDMAVARAAEASERETRLSLTVV